MISEGILQFKGMSLALVSLALLAACGGGGSGSAATSPGSTSPSSLGGTIAVGAPLVNATITLKDASGNTAGPIQVAADGSYTGLSVQGLTAPYRLRACGLLEGSPACFYALVGQAGTANVTPLTDAGVSLAIGGSAATLFDSSAVPTAAAVGSELDKLKTALQPVLAALGLSATVDLATTPFAADRTGLDKLLDAVKITTGMDGANASQAHSFVQVEGRIGSGNVLVGGDGTVSGALGAGAGLQVDLRGISSLFASLSNAIAAGTASDCATRMAAGNLFDPQFSLNIGGGPLNAASAPASICGFAATELLLGGSFANPVLKDCDFSASDKVCTVSFDIVHGGTAFDGAELAVVLRAAGTQWQLLGRESAYEIHVNAAVQRTLVIDQPSTAPSYTRAISFDILSAVDGSSVTIRAADVYQRDLNGAGWEATPLVSLDLSDACLAQSQARLAVMGSSCGSSWMMLDGNGGSATAADALIDNFYKRGRRVRVDLFADLAKTQLIATVTRRIDGVPPKSALLAEVPWLELDSASRAALVAFAGATPAFTATWLPDSAVASKDISFCLDANCSGASQAWHGDASGSPVLGGSAAMTLTAVPSAASAFKEIALYGRTREGMGVSSNYVSCGTTPNCVY